MAGNSGQFLVTRRRGRGPGRLALHDPGRSRGARGAHLRRLQRPAGTLARAGRVGRRASGGRRGRLRLAGHLEQARRRGARGRSWSRSRAGSRRTAAIKEPAELERVAAACAVADRALATLLPEIRPGVTESELALRLEWLIRTGGAEALAFDVACLSGPEAALPHGSPGDRPVLRRGRAAVRLRRPGRRLPQRHDPDALRRMSRPSATSRSTGWSPGPRRPPSRLLEGAVDRIARRGGADPLPSGRADRRRRPRA